ncbi:hypothetical protein MHYP_G00064850 [Metynnis hypsauchen]
MAEKNIIKSKKPDLIKWLSLNEMILHELQSKQLITDDEYEQLKQFKERNGMKNMIGELLDRIMKKGPSVCGQFLDLLRDENVNESCPELRDWITTLNTSGRSAVSGTSSSSAGKRVCIQADGGSNVFAPVYSNMSMGNFSMNVNMGQPCIHYANNPNSSTSHAGNQTIADNKEFLRINRCALIDNVKNVVRITDDLQLTNEMRSIVQTEPTEQAKMRKVLEFTNSTTAAKRLVDALWKHAGDVMEDLTRA